MKIKKVEIQNFRAIREFKGDFAEITSFVGANGGGKSSILQAINWFFEDFDLQLDDYFQDAVKRNIADTLSVAITFGSLNESDREHFTKYARGEEMRLVRRATRGTPRSFLRGRPFVLEDFEAIRNEPSLPKKRLIFKQLIDDPKLSYLTTLYKGDLGKISKADLESVLDQFEALPDNRKLLVERDESDATEFFGAVGSDYLRKHAGFIFVPAAPALSNEFDSGTKNSAIQLLTGTLLKSLIGGVVDRWTEENQRVLDELETLIQDSAKDGLTARTNVVNQHLRKYLPGASFKLAVGLEDWQPKASPKAKPTIELAGRETSLEYQGHGIQRATLLALLQAISTVDKGSESTSPGLIVCIEEPEVFQHPVQARMMASSFEKASANGSIQFIYATHSPYFVSPHHLESTYRVSPSPSGSIVQQASSNVNNNSSNKNGELSKYYRKPLIEGLFSSACLLVEGDTDQAVFESLVNPVTGLSLADNGISVIDCGGSNELWKIASILKAYGVPCYILRDGDSDGKISLERAMKKAKSNNKRCLECPKEEKGVEEEDKTIRDSWERGILKFVKQLKENKLDGGLEEFQWGGGQFTGSNCTILDHDIEKILENWGEFAEKASARNIDVENLRANKKAGVYAQIISECSVDSLPDDLIKIINAVENIRTLSPQDLSAPN